MNVNSDMTSNTEGRQHAYPKVEQLYPEFNMLYRGPERLGILLFVKGIKVYYFNFEKNKRFAIFEKALFQNKDVRLGKYHIIDFPQLVGLMKNESLSSPTFSPCRSICSSSSTSLNSLRSMYSEIESHSNNNLIQYATEKIRLELNDAVNTINDTVKQALDQANEQSCKQENCIMQLNRKIQEVEEAITNLKIGATHQQPGIDLTNVAGPSGTQNADGANIRQEPDRRSCRKHEKTFQTDRQRISQYFREGKAYTGARLRTRGKRQHSNGQQVNPVKPMVLQPYRGKSAILTPDDAEDFFRHYKGKPGPDILDAELRYIAQKPEAREFIRKIEPYVTGSPCPLETMETQQFIKELFELLIESQLLRPF